MIEVNEYKTLSKNALKLMRLSAVILMAVFIVVPAGAGAISVGVSYSPAVALAGFGAVLLLALLYFLIMPKLRFRRYKYLLSDDRIEVVEGVLFTKRTIVPIDRIYQIDVKRGPLDLLTGVAKIMVTTAGSFTSLRFLEPEIADEIAMYLNEHVLKKINN